MSIIRDIIKGSRVVVDPLGMPVDRAWLKNLVDRSGKLVYVDVTGALIDDSSGTVGAGQVVMPPWDDAWIEWRDQGPNQEQCCAIMIQRLGPKQELAKCGVSCFLMAIAFACYRGSRGPIAVVGNTFTPLGLRGELIAPGNAHPLIEEATRSFLVAANALVGKPDHPLPEIDRTREDVYLSAGMTLDQSVETMLCATRNVGLAAYALLNCENVAVECQGDDGRSGKKERNAKRGLRWHRLVIVKPGTKKLHGVRVPRREGQPLTSEHLCRGHFKIYTTESPLFGKYTGTYWWSPHVRGDRSAGVTLKDYRVVSARK